MQRFLTQLRVESRIKKNVERVEAEEKAKMKRPPVGTAPRPTAGAAAAAAEWDKILPFSTQRRRRLHFLPSLPSFLSKRNAFELQSRWKTILWTIGKNASVADCTIALNEGSKIFVFMSYALFKCFKLFDTKFLHCQIRKFIIN